ncbi:hypothetical protein RI845_12120 [Thalassotalea nanhaiensis]|uniref:Uncharacterized protein n=1 Tax=Thalassotalea nanhaiensis TaxID=3065648 RepID=A0ABY9THC4_9GAMM|nr:hypothetical protein RI845_12120 [Colwelliaceae bacterium SQ345]
MDKQQLTDLFVVYNSEWQLPIIGKFQLVGGRKSYFSDEKRWWLNGHFDFEGSDINDSTCRDERIHFFADKTSNNWVINEKPNYTALVYFKNKIGECDYRSGNYVQIEYPMTEQSFLDRYNKQQVILDEALKLAKEIGVTFPKHINNVDFRLLSFSKPLDSPDDSVEKATFKQSNFLFFIEYKIEKQKIKILNLETGIN